MAYLRVFKNRQLTRQRLIAEIACLTRSDILKFYSTRDPYAIMATLTAAAIVRCERSPDRDSHRRTDHGHPADD